MIERLRFDSVSPLQCDGRLWILKGPAGCGKTVLASQWFAEMPSQARTAIWITVRRNMVTAADLAAYIEAALDGADFPCSLSPVTPPSPPDRLLSRLVGLLASQPPATLFIDGSDRLGTTAAELLADLLMEAPASTRFVLTMRRYPSFARASFRARKALIELDAATLRFSDAEAAAFFTDSDPVAVTRFNEMAEGWAVSLALLAQHPDGATSQIDEYLQEEVLAALPEEVQHWLEAVCVLDSFCSDLCEAMTGGSGQRAFSALHDAGLPVQPIGGRAEWLRLHPFLGDYLRRKLAGRDGSVLQQLHLRASRWFAAHEDPIMAIRHAARSGNVAWLASLLEAECETLALEGRIDIVDHHAQQIPASILLLHPRLTAALAWLKTRSLRLDESKRLLAAAQERVASLFRRGELTPDRHHELGLHCLHQELMCAVAEGEVDRIDSLSRRLLAEAEGRKPFMLYSALTQSLAVRRETYDLAGIEGLVADAQAALTRDGYRTAQVTIASAAGSALFACGKIGRAAAVLKDGVEQSGSDGLGSIAALPLSEILYEQNAITEAQALVERYLPFARGFGFLDHLAPGHVVRGRLARLSDGPGAALDQLEESLGFARRSGLKRLTLTVGVEMVRCQLELGRRQQALALARELGFADDVGALRPGRDSTGRGETRAVGWFHLHGGSGDHAEALRLASDWARFGNLRSAPSTSIRWQLNLARLHALQSDMERATRCVRAALKTAEPIGLTRPFLDQSPAIHEIIRRLASVRTLALQPVDDFAISIAASLTTSSTGAASPLIEGNLSRGAFSEREIEILSLAGLGASNGEIGSRLGLTEGTVKWYLQQVYDKIGVRRRSQAVLIARTAGLIG